MTSPYSAKSNYEKYQDCIDNQINDNNIQNNEIFFKNSQLPNLITQWNSALIQSVGEASTGTQINQKTEVFSNNVLKTDL